MSDPDDQRDDQRDDPGRSETHEERLDRMWGDLLQELRIMQTGAQLTGGFLLTLPFQGPFQDLDRPERGLYLGLVVLAALTTALVLTPVAVHRRLSGRHTKDRVVLVGARIARAVLGSLSLLIVGTSTLIFDLVLGRTAAAVVAAAMVLTLVTLLVVLPSRLLTPVKVVVVEKQDPA